MDISATNAFIIHGKITPGMTHKTFRESLAKELLQRSELQLTPTPSRGRPPPPCLKTIQQLKIEKSMQNYFFINI